MSPPKKPDKQTWTLLLTILNLVVLVGGGGVWVGVINSRLSANIEHDREHHNDVSKHMPFEAKIATFVTRNEHDREITLLRTRLAEDISAIRNDQTQMEQKIDKLIEHLN